MRLNTMLTDRWGRSVPAEFDVRLDTVEIRVGQHLAGVADRERLRAWLTHPDGIYIHDELAWIPAPSGGAVALAIDDLIPAIWLEDTVLADLRKAM